MRIRPAVIIALLAFVVALLCPPSNGGTPRKQPPRPAQVIKIVKQRGFSWRDAGIGAAAAGAGIAVITAAGLVLLRAQQPRATE